MPKYKAKKNRTINAPTFREEQVNKRLNIIIPFKEVLEENIKGSISAGLNVFRNEEAMMFLCFAKKTENQSPPAQYQISILGTPIRKQEKVSIRIPDLNIKMKISDMRKKKK